MSQALGRDYKGRWILNATTLEIDIIDAFGAAPPAIGFLIISTAPERGLPVCAQAVHILYICCPKTQDWLGPET